MQELPLGSVIQLLSEETSVSVCKHFEESHLAARTFGSEDESLNAVVQLDEDGSVIQDVRVDMSEDRVEHVV